MNLLDATYFLIKDDIDLVLWLNTNLVKFIQWQEDPVIAHPQVHLEGELSIYYPDWSNEITIPNGCTKEELLNAVRGV